MKRFIVMLLTLALCVGTTAAFADTAEDVVVESEGKILENGVDYTLTYRENVNPGTATVVVSFMGNYAGTMEKTFEIVGKKRPSTGGGRGSGGNRIVITPAAAYDLPYITGYEDNTFRPEAQITRAEATTAIVRAAKLEQKSDGAPFDDVFGHWAAEYIHTAADLNIVNGYEDGSFCPDVNITRAEFTKIIVRLCKYEISQEKAVFSDVSEHWAEAYIATLAKNGKVTGYADGTFHPDAPITRAEAVAIINRAVERNCASNLKMDFEDVPKIHWAYKEILKAAGTEKGFSYEK